MVDFMIPESVSFRLQLIASSLLRKDVKKIKDNIALIKKVLGANEWEKGYLLALNGVVASVESDDVQTLAHKIANQKISKEALVSFLKESEKSIKQPFRSDFEKGYELAWRDLLVHFKDL